MKNFESFKLNNGVIIPGIGYGTYLLNPGEETYQSVKNAIKVGYRLIDCATVYNNEIDVGRALKDSGLKRSDVFITSKVWNTCETYEDTMDGFNKTLSDLDTDYLDLYLIHFPNPLPFRDHYLERDLNCYKAMEDLYKKGKIRAIGMSNSEVHHLEEMKEHIEIPIMVDQIEFHPYYFNKSVYQYAKENDIVIEAHSSLGRGRILEDELLNRLAIKYNKSIAQICGRYDLQHGVVTLMKSKNEKRMSDNLDILNFNIDDEDMKMLDELVKPENKIGSWPDKATY